MTKLEARLLIKDAEIKEAVKSLISLSKEMDRRITQIEEEEGSPQELAELKKQRHDIEETLGKKRFECIIPNFAREAQPR